MKSKIFFLSLLIGSLIVGCVKEPFELKFKTDDRIPPVIVVSPCTYNDTINVTGITGCKGFVKTEMADHFDYEEAIARWYSSAATFVIYFNGNYGFDVVEETTEYDLSKNTPVSISIVDYGAFPTKSYGAKSGKLYLTRLANGKLRADWCNIIFKDKDNNTYPSSGGFLFPKK